jgi:hypothetical protein
LGGFNADFDDPEVIATQPADGVAARTATSARQSQPLASPLKSARSPSAPPTYRPMS